MSGPTMTPLQALKAAREEAAALAAAYTQLVDGLTITVERAGARGYAFTSDFAVDDDPPLTRRGQRLQDLIDHAAAGAVRLSDRPVLAPGDGGPHATTDARIAALSDRLDAIDAAIAAQEAAVASVVTDLVRAARTRGVRFL